MNITESAIIAAIILAISGSALWFGGKVMDQIESHTAFMEVAADPANDAEAIERAARKTDEQRRKVVAQYASE